MSSGATAKRSVMVANGPIYRSRGTSRPAAANGSPLSPLLPERRLRRGAPTGHADPHRRDRRLPAATPPVRSRQRAAPRPENARVLWAWGCSLAATDGRSCSRQAPIASMRIRVTCWCTSTKSAFGKQRAERRTVGGSGAGRTATSVYRPVRHHDRSLRGGTAAHPDRGELPRIAGRDLRGGESLLPRLWSDANPLW